MGNITPTVGKMLIKPLKEVIVSKRITVPDDEKNKDKKQNEVMETKKVTKRLPSNFQLAKVVSVPVTNALYEVGDIIVFRPNPAAYLSVDLIKDLYLIDNFLVVGKWNEE